MRIVVLAEKTDADLYLQLVGFPKDLPDLNKLSPPYNHRNEGANKAREHLRAVMGWAWKQDLLDALPGFPKARQQRDVAGRHYLTKEEINALYFATHRMKRPRGWDQPFPVGRFWRCVLVVFFNYGVDTGTVWKSAPGL